MIKHTVAAVALVALPGVASVACAAPGNGPPAPGVPSSLPASVAPGCDLSGTRVRWSEPAKHQRLIRVTVFRRPGNATGEQVFDEPYSATVAGVAAPADWTARLAESLGAEAGYEIQVGPARMKDGNYGTFHGGEIDSAIPETLLYESAETVSADFTVDCDQPVSGTFASWTSTSLGSIACGQVDEPTEPLDRLARQYCPRTPTPPRSSTDAGPSDAGQPD